MKGGQRQQSLWLQSSDKTGGGGGEGTWEETILWADMVANTQHQERGTVLAPCLASDQELGWFKASGKSLKVQG